MIPAELFFKKIFRSPAWIRKPFVIFALLVMSILVGLSIVFTLCLHPRKGISTYDRVMIYDMFVNFWQIYWPGETRVIVEALGGKYYS